MPPKIMTIDSFPDCVILKQVFGAVGATYPNARKLEEELQEACQQKYPQANAVIGVRIAANEHIAQALGTAVKLAGPGFD